jgi:hypothetical protein
METKVPRCQGAPDAVMAQTGTERKKNYNTITDSENKDEASLLELKKFKMIMMNLKADLQTLVIDVP